MNNILNKYESLFVTPSVFKSSFLNPVILKIVRLNEHIILYLMISMQIDCAVKEF